MCEVTFVGAIRRTSHAGPPKMVGACPFWTALIVPREDLKNDTRTPPLCSSVLLESAAAAAAKTHCRLAPGTGQG